MSESTYREFLFFRVGTVSGSTLNRRKPSTLLVAAQHNHREIQAELGADSHIDATRSHLNHTIAGHSTAAEVVAQANARLARAGIKVESLRKDHVQAVELLFSLSPETEVNTIEYFSKCVAWAAKQFGEDNVLSAVIHHDEDAPHCHLLLLPLINNTMVGGRQIDQRHLPPLRSSFAKSVALPAGLRMPSARLRGNARAHGDRLVNRHIEDHDDPVLGSKLWPIFRNIIRSDPAIFMDALNLEIPVRIKGKRKMKTSTAIFISKGKGQKKVLRTGTQ
ncbi:MAG: plasmid recombination protein [Pseudomonadota bacterium]